MREPTTGELFQPTDPAFLVDPYPMYARLRDEAPIAWFEGWSAVIVTRHRDVDALLRDWRLGRVIDPADASNAPPPDPAHAPFAAIQAGSLLEIEPPDHTRIKQAVHDVSTPRHVRALRERIDAIIRERIDALARLELQSALSGLLRLPNLRLDGAPPSYQPRNVFRYLTSLPVAY